MAHPLRHAGIHWPANAGGEHPSVNYLLQVPGIAGACTIVADSARFWYDRNPRTGQPGVRETYPDAMILWRGLPRPERPPARLGWDPVRVAAECVNLWDEQPHWGTEWFTPLNELQFEKESGEPVWQGYADMAAKLARLRPALRAEFGRRGQDVRLMFPAWVPKDDGDRLDEWRGEAEQWDGLVLHCYGSASTMAARYWSYRNAFPGKPIIVGEWNSNHEGHDEYDSVSMWAQVAAADPLFLGATYYIWETNNAGEHDLSIWSDEARLALFLHPPGRSPVNDGGEVEPDPELPPGPDPDPGVPDGGAVDEFPLPVDEAGNEWQASYEQIIAAAVEIAPQEGVKLRTLIALLIAESGRDCQQQERWHIWTDHGKEAVRQRNLGYAAQVLGWGKDVGTIGTNDYSAGPAHKAWAWSDEFPGNPTDPNDPHRWDVMGWLRFRKKYIQDHGYAIRVAARDIKPYQDRRPDDDQWVLERYNKPNGEVSAAVRANYTNGLRVADEIIADLGQVPDPVDPPVPVDPPTPPPVPEHSYIVGTGVMAKMQEMSDRPATDELYFPPTVDWQYSQTYGVSGLSYVHLRATSTTHVFPHNLYNGGPVSPVDPPVPPTAWEPTIIQSSSPNVNGLRRGQTLGCVMHSTNGRGSTPDNEFNGTLNWFKNPASEVSAHIVIHADGTIAEVVDPAYRAWHAGEHNDAYLGIELAKPEGSSVISDEQLRSAAWWLKRQAARWGFELTAATLPQHKDTLQGRRVGKIDIGGNYSFERLSRFF